MSASAAHISAISDRVISIGRWRLPNGDVEPWETRSLLSEMARPAPADRARVKEAGGRYRALEAVEDSPR